MPRDLPREVPNIFVGLFFYDLCALGSSTHRLKDWLLGYFVIYFPWIKPSKTLVIKFGLAFCHVIKQYHIKQCKQYLTNDLLLTSAVPSRNLCRSTWMWKPPHSIQSSPVHRYSMTLHCNTALLQFLLHERGVTLHCYLPRDSVKCTFLVKLFTL